MSSQSSQSSSSESSDEVPPKRLRRDDVSGEFGSLCPLKLFSYTENKVVRMTFEWTINNVNDVFAALTGTDNIFRSKKCLAPGEKNAWKLQLSVLVKKKQSFLKFKIWNCWWRRDEALEAQFEIIIVNPVVNTPQHFTFPRKQISQGGGFRAILSDINELWNNNSHAKEDELIIRCQLNYSKLRDKNDLITMAPNWFKFQGPCCGVNKDLMDLFTTMRLSDVTFQFPDGKKLQAHKCVLGARSPVFAAMFEANMKEKLADCVEIDDVNPEVFSAMIRFCYSDRISKSEETAKLLLPVADKYLIELLKENCEKILINMLNIQNCADALALSELHSAKKLKTAAINFFHEFAHEVITTPGWQIIKKENASLCLEVFEFGALKMRNKNL